MYKIEKEKEFLKRLKKESKDCSICNVKIQNGTIDVFFDRLSNRTQLSASYSCDYEIDDKFIFLSSIHTTSNLFQVLCCESGFSFATYEDTYQMREKDANCKNFVSQIIFQSKIGTFEHKELCNNSCKIVTKK